MTIKMSRLSWESRVAANEYELQYRYRRAVDELDALRGYLRTRDRETDNELDWSCVAELNGSAAEVGRRGRRKRADGRGRVTRDPVTGRRPHTDPDVEETPEIPDGPFPGTWDD